MNINLPGFRSVHPVIPTTAGATAVRPPGRRPLALQKNRARSGRAALVRTFSVALLAVASLASVHPASAQDPGVSQTSPRARGIEGLWESAVTVVNPQTGAPLRMFRGVTLFAQGGSLIATNNQPNVTTLSGTQLGRWQYLGHRQYTASFRFFRFNPDGSFAGSQRVVRTFTLSKDGQSFTGTIQFNVLDGADNVVMTGQSTESGARVP